MATRGNIAKVQDDGTIKAIYTHWDSYLEYNGAILWKHYQDEDKIDELLSNGNLSSLGIEIGTKHDFNNNNHEECTFYGRDRGEKDQDAVTFDNLKSYLESDTEEFAYIRKGGKWFYRENYSKTLKVLPNLSYLNIKKIN